MASVPAPLVTLPVMQIVLNGQLATGGSNPMRSGNVFYYRKDFTVPAVNKLALSNAFQAALLPSLLAAANVRYTPVSNTLRLMNDPTDGPVTFAAAGVGAIGTDSEPSEDAVVIVLKNGFRGPVFRGFKHFGGTSEVDTTQDILTGAGLARWQAVRNACLVPLTDATGAVWTPFILSNLLADYKVNPAIMRGSDCTVVKLDLVIGNMRKRKAHMIY